MSAELEWAVLEFSGVNHVVPYFGREMTGWHMDEISYCSDDASKVIDWVAKANASLK